jgi:hypothetical protein
VRSVAIYSDYWRGKERSFCVMDHGRLYQDIDGTGARVDGFGFDGRVELDGGVQYAIP